MNDPPDRRYQREILARRLREEGEIRSEKVMSAFLEVPRELFVPEGMREEAYSDRPLPIGKGQTISAPHMVAIMSEEMMLEPGHRVLEIGTGSGYHAAITSRLILPDGWVFSVERIHELVLASRANLSSAGIENVIVLEGDGSVGLEREAPFDRIYYTCAAPALPRKVRDQLSDDGIALGVIGPKYGTQRLIRYIRKGDRIKKEPLTYCVFVPLIGKLGY